MGSTKARWAGLITLTATFVIGCTEHGDERVEFRPPPDEAAPTESERSGPSRTALECMVAQPSVPTDPATMRLVGACLHATDDVERCDPELLVSAGAATCIAWASGVNQGVTTPEVTPVAHSRALFWRIVTTTEQTPTSRSGESWRVDARTGELQPGLGWGEHGLL